MRTEYSWKLYLRRVQHYLDSDECLLPGLVVVSHGRMLQLVRHGVREDSDTALQCLQSAIEYADSFTPIPLDDPDEPNDTDGSNPRWFKDQYR